MAPQAVKAEYLSQDIIEFKNNPFIEALPPLSDFRRLGAQLTVRPPYSEGERFLPDEVRLMLTQRIVPQNYLQLKMHKLYISGVFHLIFSVTN